MSRTHARKSLVVSILSLCLAACGGDDRKGSGIDAAVSDAGASVNLDAGSLLDAALDGSLEDDWTPPDAGTFLPTESMFNYFHQWPSMNALPPPQAPTGPHSLGTMTVYINHLPKHGTTSFPVGTLIVKETAEADPTQRQTFGLAKRGGDYNASGAHGWEWFEFTNHADGTVFMKWRGFGPPPTTGSDPADNCSGYGGDPEVCNGCHLAAEPNDFIWTVGLDLSKF